MTSHKDVPPELEKAVQTLLKPPNVYYLKEIREATKADPTYLFNNETTVGSAIQKMLADSGTPLPPEMIQRQWQKVLGIALHRLKAA